MTPPPAELRTARLILRRWREADIAPFERMSADPDVMRYFDRTRTPEECARLRARIEDAFRDDGFGGWAIELPGVAPFIGFAGAWRAFEGLPCAPAVELAWRIDAPWWGQGYAPEAARAAVADIFARTDIGDLVAMTAVPNAPSRRVMEKLGMTRDPAEDFDHPRVPVDNPMCRHVLYRLTRAAFEARAA